jgi:tetratricopeptide (TPR) repeat protein/CHAT domain-containing protein
MKKAIICLIFVFTGFFIPYYLYADTDSKIITEMKRLYVEGSHFYDISNYKEALVKWEKGLELAEQSKRKQSIGPFLTRIGQAHRRLGQYDQALSYYEKALSIARKNGYRKGEGANLTHIGLVYHNLGQYEKALSYYEKSLVITREIGDRRGEGANLVNIGIAHNNLSHYNRALSHHEKALAIDRELGDQRGEGDDLTNIGNVYLHLGQYEKALSYYEKSDAIARELGSRKSEGKNLTNIGNVYLYLGQYEKALSYYEKSLVITREIGDRRGEGKSLTNIGLVYADLGQYEKALSYHEKALVIDRDLGERSGERKNLLGIGNVYLHLGQYEKALSYYEKSLVITREIGDRRGEGNSLTNIGNVYADLGQYEKALSYYEKSLVITREIGDRRGEGNSLTNIGIVYADLGHYEKALSYHEKALAIAREIGDRSGEGANQNSIGSVYMLKGQYEKALSYLEKALAIDKDLGDRSGEGKALINIGIVYDNLGQHEKALSYYEKALAIDEEIGDRRDEGLNLGNIGIVYHELSQYNNALSYYEKALAISREVGDRRGEMSDLLNIGVMYKYLGQYEKALSYYEKSLAIARELGDRSSEGKNLLNIGLLYADLGQYEKAHQSFKESLEICMEVGAPETLWKVQRGMGLVESKMKMFDDAVLHYEQALDTIESMRAGLSEKEAKTTYMKGKLFVYDELITLLQTLHKMDPSKGYDKNSLEIFERKQGRVFLEEMGKSGARNFAGIPETITTYEQNLSLQMAKLKSDLANERSKPKKQLNAGRIKNLEEKIDEVGKEQKALQEKIRVDYPDYYAIKYPKPATLKELQNKVLKPGEMILVYGVMEKNTCLWVIGQKHFGLYIIDISEKDLGKKIDRFKKGPEKVLDAIKKGKSGSRIYRTAQRSLTDIRRDGADLYHLLVPEDVRGYVNPAKTLYIVPTGCLYSIPFEALTVKDQVSKKDRYLVETHSLAYLSSASLLKILREAEARKKETPAYPLLAFANPVYQKKDADKKPEPENKTTIKGLRTRAYLDIMGGIFEELPNTEDEVKEIKKILKAPDETQPLQLRELASRTTVFAFNQAKKLDDYQYIIFSCHGILPGEIDRVTQPALVLSLPDPATGTDDYLTMGDVFGLKLNADLVTLSACNTGKGKAVRGEGVMGLTRAFMYAGTPTISVTLWSVESGSAKTLSTGLFGNLTKSKDKAQALRLIKLKMISGEYGKLYQHPFFWAPVVIFGDGK